MQSTLQKTDNATVFLYVRQFDYNANEDYELGVRCSDAIGCACTGIDYYEDTNTLECYVDLSLMYEDEDAEAAFAEAKEFQATLDEYVY